VVLKFAPVPCIHVARAPPSACRFPCKQVPKHVFADRAMSSDEARKIATTVVRGYLKEAVLRHRDRESLRTPCSEDGCSTLTWDVEWQSDAPRPPPGKRPGRRRRRKRRELGEGCRDTLQAPPETASEVLCLLAPPKPNPQSPTPQLRAQAFPRVTTAGLSYAVVPTPPTPKWLIREANKARIDIERSQRVDVPQSMYFSPQLGRVTPDIPDAQPSLNLRMYKKPMEAPWLPQRAKPQRGQKQAVSSNGESIKSHDASSFKSSKRSAAAASGSSTAAATGFSSATSDRGTVTISENSESHSEMIPKLSRSQMLPKLVDEEKMQAWREGMVASAMSMARTCDVPRGLLLRTGALGFQ